MVGEFAAAGDADLAEDGLEMVLDGVGADAQPGGDFLGAVAGETITGPDGQAQGISVVIGPARPGTVLPILAAAYGLTGREQEVIRGVFAGYSTKEISARLRISTYTVQDHLKSIFGKVGVTSRGELAHHLALQFT